MTFAFSLFGLMVNFSLLRFEVLPVMTKVGGGWSYSEENHFEIFVFVFSTDEGKRIFATAFFWFKKNLIFSINDMAIKLWGNTKNI